MRFEAGDTDQAMAYVANCAMPLVKKGDLLTLLGWQRASPTDLMRGQIKVKPCDRPGAWHLPCDSSRRSSACGNRAGRCCRRRYDAEKRHLGMSNGPLGRGLR